MREAFVDSTTMEGQQRIRGYVLAWLERLDYAGDLERDEDPDVLGARLWEWVDREYAPVWKGEVVTNAPLARVIASTMVEDYLAAFPRRRASRYSVAGPLGDAEFRRCVLDFVHDLEEFEPESLPERPEAAADVFWSDVRENARRWGYDPARGPFVDDEFAAARVVLEAIRDYYALKAEAAELPLARSAPKR